MQNKGFVRLLAIALALVCIFYLSFSFVTNSYNKKAAEYAQGDSNKQFKFLDSIAGEQIWLGYTLKECREKEINLGLDLKGGMNVTLEVSVADILKALSGYNTNELFNEAVKNAQIRNLKSSGTFLSIFQEEFEKLDPNAKLSVIFSTVELKDKIQLSSTNSEVVKVLQEEIDGAISNSFNVLRSRIDRFGVVQPNIQKLDAEGRILVELPGIKEPERVRKLLQGSANLEFWETYEASTLMPMLREANSILRELNEVKEANNETKVEAKAETAVAQTEVVADSLALSKDSLLADLKEKKDAEEQQKALEEFKKNNPLFAVLNVYENSRGPVVGAVLASDTAEVNAIFAMKQVREILPKELSLKWTVKAIDPEAKQPVFALIALNTSTNKEGRAPLEGDVITDANVDFDQFSARANVSMKMNSEGAKVWERMTGNNIGKSIAIVLDDYVYSYPTVNSKIAGGSSQITGNFTTEEAKDLANVLKSGKMPAPARIVQEDVVGPSLGQVAINDGLTSFIIAFVLVLIYMVLYYGVVPGLIADGALLCNIFFLFGVLASFQAVLTLPGIAGIVLTMGMAVDANVLIYERIREELLAGKNLKKAITDGYSNAFSAIIDSNLTTIITGITLFAFGTGPIKGFATTLIIGIVTSFFTAIFLTRLVYERMLKNEKERNMPFTTNFTKNWFKNTNFNFVKLRKTGYIISAVLIVVAVISLTTRGLKQGIDFSGGRNYIVRFESEVNTDDVRETLSHVFEEAQTSVITMGAANQVRISTNYNIASQDENVDTQIEDMLYNGLKPYLNENVTKQMFVERYEVIDGEYVASKELGSGETFGIQSSQKVGPSVAEDIKTSAMVAILLALVFIFLYILIRFRNYAFSVGATAGLIHDTVVILGVYSVFYSIMPFSLEIDQSFIAAILTVIGYSINDTVVVFDRIRENLGLYPKREFGTQINASLNATLSRTFSTSLSTAIVLIAIFIFGGEVIRGFVFALLLGVIVGTYSTLFVATPIAYEIENKQAKKKAALNK